MKERKDEKGREEKKEEEEEERKKEKNHLSGGIGRGSHRGAGEVVVHKTVKRDHPGVNFSIGTPGKGAGKDKAVGVRLGIHDLNELSLVDVHFQLRLGRI